MTNLKVCPCGGAIKTIGPDGAASKHGCTAAYGPDNRLDWSCGTVRTAWPVTAQDGSALMPTTANIIRLADVRRERVTWLDPGRIPLGKLTVLDGDPGLGKSTVTIDYAARVS